MYHILSDYCWNLDHVHYSYHCLLRIQYNGIYMMKKTVTVSIYVWLLSLQVSGKNATKYQNNTSNGAQNAIGKAPQCSISNEDTWE